MRPFRRVLEPRRVTFARRPRLRLKLGQTLERPLRTLGGLLRRSGDEAPALFHQSLELLQRQVGADLVALVRATGEGFEWSWHVPEEPSHAVPMALCRWILDNPGRTLHLRDAAKDRIWAGHPELKGLGAALGTAYYEGSRPSGALLALCARPKSFSRNQVALLHTVAGMLGKALEVEMLRLDLHRMQEALALTAAVVEDSALQDPATDLPNRRYLDIWLKANLYLAKRRGEPMACLRWNQPTTELKMLRPVAESLRGEDLLVCEGHGRCLLLLPRTPKGGAQILFGRIRMKVGSLPMAATLWDPDQDDLELSSVRGRLEEGLTQARTEEKTGLLWLEEG
jgi:hypothetical protein